MSDITYSYEFVNHQHMVGSSDYSWKELPNGKHIGPIEQAEEYRADRIDALVAQRNKVERRNFKGY